MPANKNNPSPFQLGAFHVDPARNVMALDQIEYSLEPRIMDVLCVLAEAQGEVVPRSTLIERLWRVEYGADESLTRAISMIRKVVREAGETDAYIETIKKRGYRLLKPATTPAATVEIRPAEPVKDEGRERRVAIRSRRRRPPIIALIGVLVVSAALGLIVLRGNHPGEDTPSASPVEKSVAVLPFQALSNDDSDAYFGNGIAEELLNSLARFPDLKVAARTSAFALDGMDLGAVRVGESLGVTNVVQGSVRRAGNRVRVTVKLIRTSDGENLWSNTYESDAADLFGIEDEIVRAISATLQVRLGVGAGAGRSGGAGVDPLAYEQYLQGLTLWGDRMRKDGTRAGALAAFERAVAFDPEFGDAWAGIGVVGALSAGSPLSRESATFRQKTENAFKRALELDSNNAVAHAGLATWHVSQRIDIAAARHHLERAMELAPNAAQTQYAAATVYRALGDADRALAAYDRAIALDPLNNVIKRVRAELLVLVGRGQEGMDFFDACHAQNCLGEGFVHFATTAAILHSDPGRMANWLPVLNAFDEKIGQIPEHKKPLVTRVIAAFFSAKLGRPDAGAQVERVRVLYANELITDTPGIWAPTFASFLPRETLMNTLHLAYERGDLFSASFAFSPLYGANPYPDWVLRHPRYHELWARPGMADLAAEWRASGQTAGLPKPILD